MLDLVAADAGARGAHQEALTALDARRSWVVAEQLLALGRQATAQYLAQRAASTSATSRRRLKKPAPTEPVDRAAIS